VPAAQPPVQRALRIALIRAVTIAAYVVPVDGAGGRGSRRRAALPQRSSRAVKL